MRGGGRRGPSYQPMDRAMQPRETRLTQPPSPARAAIVLCGGHSRRMGRDKALLPFADTTFLQRVVSQVAPAVGRIAIVGQPGQHASRVELFPQGVVGGIPVQVVDDLIPDRGPLEGLRCGLQSLGDSPSDEIVFVCGCDYPLLSPQLVAWMCQALRPGDGAGAPSVDDQYWPLPAVYRIQVLPIIEQLLAVGRRSLLALLRAIPVTPFSEAALRQIDPELDALRSVDTPEALEWLRQKTRDR